MSERKPSVADALTTAYFIVLSVWSFWNGYTLQWLIGVPLGVGAYLVVHSVFNSMERRK